MPSTGRHWQDFPFTTVLTPPNRISHHFYVAEFARIQGAAWVCRNSGEFRDRRVGGTLPRCSLNPSRPAKAVKWGRPLSPAFLGSDTSHGRARTGVVSAGTVATAPFEMPNHVQTPDAPRTCRPPFRLLLLQLVQMLHEPGRVAQGMLWMLPRAAAQLPRHAV
jgi:hypothetical protein